MALPVLGIIGIVEIGQAQRMGEFVDGRPDSALGGTGYAPKFGGAEVLAGDNTVQGDVQSVRRPMRPDGMGGAFRLAVTGVIHEDHINLTVVVLVVLGKVDGRVQLLQSVFEDPGRLGRIGFVRSVG